MKNAYTNSNLKDTITASALLTAMFVGIVGTAFTSFEARATESAMATQVLDTIVISAPRMGVERLEPIVISARRATAA